MKKRAQGQLSLALQTPDADAWIACTRLFSLNYLKQHVLRADFVPSTDAAGRLHAKVKALWEEERGRLPRQHERYTCSAFLEPILADLGWMSLPEKALPFGQFTRKRPDFCLFTAPDSRNAAAESTEPVRVFSLVATVLEAKQFGHPLDRESKTETKGWFPSQQIQDYLRHAKDPTGRRYFNWAILTNGNEWRLYTERSSADAYFSFTLVNPDGSLCSLADFRIFRALFSPDAFIRRADGACGLDDIQTEATRFQTELESNLKRRVFNVLEELATAFANHPDNAIPQEDYTSIYDASLVFLYRLLFVL